MYYGTVKRLAGNKIELGSEIPTTEFRESNIPMTKGTTYVVDTSPTYLQFLIVPCYYIIHLGCFICIYMLFHMIFGTNLLT